MNLLGTIKKSLATYSLASLALLSVSKGEENRKYPYFEADLGIRYEKSIIADVNNIPLWLRDVPIHPDDYKNSIYYEGYGGNQAPINKTDLSPSSKLNLGGVKLKVQADFFKETISIKTGIGVELVLPSNGANEYNHRKDIAERNYMGGIYGVAVGSDTRGTGTALTYVATGVNYGPNWNEMLKPYLFAEIETKLSNSSSLGLGVKLSQENLFVENGWDRYDSLEKRESHELAKYTLCTPQISYKYRPHPDASQWFGALDIGMTLPIKKVYTPLSKEMKIKENSFAPSFGLRAGYKF